jgi:hypothetical protein
MLHFRNFTISIVAFSFFCFVIPQKAYAYLDPGTGSYILQLLIGVLVGSSVAIKIYWARIRAFFRSLFSNSQKDE